MLMHAEFAEVSGLVGELRVLLQDLVSPVGLEPTTNGLKGRCSTTELQARLLSGAFRYHDGGFGSTTLDFIRPVGQTDDHDPVV